jgi:hypothetical protein
MTDTSNTSKPRRTRKKSYKKMSFDELIKEKEAALAVINELREMAMNTLLEIEELTKKLNVSPNPVSISKNNYVDPTSAQFAYTPPNGVPYSFNNQEIEQEDEKETIEFTAQSDAGEVSIRLIDPEENMNFRQYMS